MNRLMALIKREYWENKGAFRTTPLVIGGVYIVLTLMFGLLGLALGGLAMATLVWVIVKPLTRLGENGRIAPVSRL